MSELDDEARSIFLALVDRPQDEWPAAVEKMCAERPALRALVERLLADHVFLGAVSEGPGRVDDRTATSDGAIDAPGDVVAGRFKLLEPLGEGGFGVVFLAEQTAPVRRKVAIKILKAGMDTRQVIARFEAERQALAMMDHSNIARVFDGGVTRTGRPYFAMEYVKGVPITEYCDRHRLPPQQRLELFVDVCKAVQHAHQKGIIHRDIKPTNVMVTRHDTTPVVKVIDFGVAKALGQELTDKTLFTNVAQLIGTPLYMSPEQAGMSDLDVDTRSDVYSLGVLLYELLTGTTPFSKERFKKVAYDEIRRIIREEDPPKPSTRLSESTETLPSVAANRGVEPKKLGTLVRGELDWIVMKALEKDRNRRYESANGFAADVLRHLAGEAVTAAPPSAWYRLRKAAARHRTAFAASAIGAVVVAAIIVGLAISNRLISREKERGDRHLGRVKDVLEKYFADTSEDRRLQAAGLHDLRKSLLVSMAGILEEFAQEESDDRTLRRLRVWSMFKLALVWMEVGDSEKSLAYLQRARESLNAMAAESPDPWVQGQLADCANNEGVQLLSARRFGEAVAAFQRVLKIREDLATQFPTEADHLSSVGAALHGLAMVEFSQKRHKEARAFMLQAIDRQSAAVGIDPTDRKARAFLANHNAMLGLILADLKLLDESAAAQQRAQIAYRQLADEFPDDPAYRKGMATAWSNLGYLAANERPEEALSAYRQGLDVLDRLAADFPSVAEYRRSMAGAQQNIGLALRRLGRSRDADAAFDAALTIREQLIKEHPNETQAKIELAASLVRRGCDEADAGRFDVAEKTLSRARAAVDTLAAPDRQVFGVPGLLLRAHGARADCLLRLARFDEALKEYDLALSFETGAMRPHLRIQRAIALAQLNEHAKASAEAAAVVAEGKSPVYILQDAAAVHAICSSVVRNDPKQSEKYAVTAVATLRQALEKNYKAVAAEVNGSKNFDSIRTREDFKKLMAEFEAKEPK